MKRREINIRYTILLISTFFIYSCLEDITPPSFTGELSATAEMLLFFESNGDFINSNMAPPLLDAQEVYNNLNDYLIIDIRSNDDFLAGHIPNAIHKSSDSLYAFIDSNHDSSYTRTVLVSKNGQKSSYFASLLRLAGFNKIHSLKYGMASWHTDFANEWLNSRGDDEGITAWTNDHTLKNDFNKLPNVTFPDPDITIENKVNLRVQKLIQDGFTINSEYTMNVNPASGRYTICYGKARLYSARMNGTLGGLGHPPGTVSYEDSPFYHFRSTKFLQTIPSNQEIIIYGYDGQLSASLVAYLRMLGYKSQTHLFGGNTLFYSRIVDDPELFDYIFSHSDINSFEFETGH